LKTSIWRSTLLKRLQKRPINDEWLPAIVRPDMVQRPR
jgi:hypothetical protein